jgi:hypothetical protein
VIKGELAAFVRRAAQEQPDLADPKALVPFVMKEFGWIAPGEKPAAMVIDEVRGSSGTTVMLGVNERAGKKLGPEAVRRIQRARRLR